MQPKLLTLLVIAVTLICSCSSPRYIYSSAPPNNPFFKEKGESKIAGYYSGGSPESGDTSLKAYNRGYDIQGAYALSNHWALTAAYGYRKERDVYKADVENIFSSSIVNYRRNMSELGGGYFAPINRKRTIFFSLMGGLGFGKYKHRDEGLDESRTSYARRFSMDVRKYYLQPSFNIMPGDFFRMMLTNRFSWVNYNITSTDYLQSEYDYFRFEEIDGKTKAFSETTLGVQFVIPNAPWLAIDGSMTLTTQPAIQYNRIRSRGFNASIGISFDITKIK